MTVYELIQDLSNYPPDFTIEFKVNEFEQEDITCENCNATLVEKISKTICDFDETHGSNVFKEVAIYLDKR